MNGMFRAGTFRLSARGGAFRAGGGMRREYKVVPVASSLLFVDDEHELDIRTYKRKVMSRWVSSERSVTSTLANGRAVVVVEQECTPWEEVDPLH